MPESTKPKKRGRKKKSQLLKIHEQEQTNLLERLNKLELYSTVGFAMRDMITIAVALDSQVTSIEDLFTTFAPDVFRAMKVD